MSQAVKPLLNEVRVGGGGVPEKGFHLDGVAFHADN